MKYHPSIRAAVRVALTAGLAASVGIPAIASAENAQNPANLGKISVTGTRIKRTSIVTAQPITEVTQQQIQNSGLKDIGQILSNLPSVLQTQTPTTGFYSNGTRTIELRYLGSNRLIVLVDGRRWNSNFSGITDLNQIPVSIVDHIEILQDGASAVYGSDAIAGVVNIITKKDFNGMEADAYYGIDEGKNSKRNGGGQIWDGQTQHYSVTLGLSGDQGHFIINGSYRAVNGIPSPDRTFGNYSQQTVGRGSSTTPQGRFLFNPPFGGDPTKPGNPPAAYTGLTLDQCPDSTYGTDANPLYLPYCDLTIEKGTSGQNPADYRPFTGTGPDQYFDTDEPISGDQDIKTIYGSGSYNIAPWISANTTVLYQRRQYKKPRSAALVFFTDPGDTITADSPYNPFDFTMGTDIPVPGLPANAAGVPNTLSGIYRRAIELGRRFNTYDTHTFRFQGGFSGSFMLGQTGWDWDADYIYMSTVENDGSHNLVNTVTLPLSLSGPAVCGKIEGCVPLNLFGGQGVSGNGSITPEQIQYVRMTYNSSSEKDLRVIDANVTSSDIFDLPGGPLGLAFGYQHRVISADSKPSAIGRIKTSANPNPSEPEKGSYNVDAVYAELNVPVLSKLPGVNYLGVDGATRWSDYSTFGHTWNSKVGVKYQPISDLVLRGTYSEGFRAASVNSLFSPVYTAYPFASDPCSNYGQSGVSPAVVSNCKAAGVPASYVQQNEQINTLEGGNVHLQPETSVSKTFGFVYSPSWLPGFDLNADYFHITLNDTIQSISTQTLLNNCYYLGQGCSRVTRITNGRILNVRNQVTNIGAIRTAGIDVGATYKFPSTPYGDFTLRFDSTKTNFYHSFFPRPDGTQAVTSAVHYTNRQSTSIPEWKANLRLDYDYGPWSVALTAHYMSGLTYHCSDYDDNTPISLTALGFCSNPNFKNNNLSVEKPSSVHWYDAQVSYATPWNATVTVGARNLFETPPPRYSVGLSGGDGYDPYLYSDLIGRYIYGEINVKF
jgi:iron complex outermembrane receptor protein